MLDDWKGHGIRTDLLSAGGLSFDIGNLYLEPINEDCTIMRCSEINFAFEDSTLPNM
jgi:hypothetical protein